MTIRHIIETEFPLDIDMVYLNHAAVSPWPKRAAEAVKAFADENTQSGAKNYLAWLKIDKQLRKQLQQLINAPSTDDIALLKNTSEALSVVAEGIKWNKGDNVVSSNQEFPSNRIPWLAQAKHGVEFKEIDISNPDTAEDDLINACNENTRLLTISSVQYGTGQRLNLKKLGQYCHENNILFCVDAIQSLGVLAMNVDEIHADFVMADAHKWLMGPEGIALFYCRQSVRYELELHQFGWHMVENAGNYDMSDWQAAKSARRFECGSPNMIGIHALGASLSLIESVKIENITRMALNNTKYIIDYISNNRDVVLITPRDEHHHAGIVTFKVKNKDNKDIYDKLMKNNVICANRAGGIRFSPHFYTNENNIEKGLDILFKILN